MKKAILAAALLISAAQSETMEPNIEPIVVARYAPSAAPSEFYIDRMSDGGLRCQIPEGKIIFMNVGAFIPSEQHGNKLIKSGKLELLFPLQPNKDMSEEELVDHLAKVFGCGINVTKF